MKEVFKKYVLILFWLAFALYIFVVPAAAINGWVEESHARIGLFITSFAVSMGLWSWIFLTLIAAASSIYGFKKIEIWRFELNVREIGAEGARIKIRAVVLLFVSAFALIYCFAILYGLIATFDPYAFTVEKISLVSAVYFSVFAMTNSLAGDILPVSDIARFLVVIQVAFGAFYALFFFSILTAFLRDNVSK